MFRINMLSAIPRCLLFEVVFSLTTTNYTSASITERAKFKICWLSVREGNAYEISRATKKHERINQRQVWICDTLADVSISIGV